MGDSFVDSALVNVDEFTAPLQQVLLHSGVYCGAPAVQEAFRAAKEVLTP